MTIYRIARTEYCDVTGEGAKKYGGRWNFPGNPALYGSSSVSTALLERLTIDPELFSAERYIRYSVMEIRCQARFIFKPKSLPKGWEAIPPTEVSQTFGTDLLQRGIACFAVPSVVDQTSFNYVLNPLSTEFKRFSFKVYPLRIDPRIAG